MLSSDVMSFIVVISVVMLVCAVYFAPSVIASHREHPNLAPIIIINIFFGWTLLGWVICLAWAFSHVKNLQIKHS